MVFQYALKLSGKTHKEGFFQSVGSLDKPVTG